MSLLRENYRLPLEPYPIERPAIPSGETYYFTTSSDLRYQVRFARKKTNYLEHVVNFSVLNEAFDDEYSETNRGEIYRVMATLVEIMLVYHKAHSLSRSYEFCGEFKKGNEGRAVSIRTLLYERKAREILDPSWKVERKGNRVTIFLSAPKNH